MWLFGAIATMGLMLSGPPRANAQQGVTQTLEDTFQLHGYVENQEIIRSENYVGDYNVASIRNRIDLQPSGHIIDQAHLAHRDGPAPGNGSYR